jgi:hypothetical protein
MQPERCFRNTFAAHPEHIGDQLLCHQQFIALKSVRKRPNSLDPPTWLWSSVVELMGLHESAYLDHCRKIVGRLPDSVPFHTCPNRHTLNAPD